MTEETSVINNYILKEDIGQGNFGKVKLGIYKPTNEEFAIKIINKKMIKIKMKNILFKENEIITKFNHINVIYVYQIIDTPENYYIIMEYCKKGELFDYIVKNQRIREDEASVFFYQLINGVEYIHSKGIAHRDLKPENILLTEDKILKIIDFGLSHEFKGEDFLKTKCGSPSYASPEIIANPFYDGFKTDIWCCGIILYAMICGYLPFDGDDKENNNDTLFRNIIECNIEFPDTISEMAKDLISKLLTVNPNERITIPDIKEHPFYLKGKYLCKLDYDLIEENIIKKRSNKNISINNCNNNIDSNTNKINIKNKKKSNELNNKKIKNIKKLKIETDDNYNYNNNLSNEEDKNIYNYLISNSIQSNNNENMNSIYINTNNKAQIEKNIYKIISNYHKLNKDNQITNIDINKLNHNLIPMIKISKNFNIIDKIFNSKLNNNTKYNHNNNIFKPSFKDILKEDKNSLYFNAFVNKKNGNNYLKTLENPIFLLDKKNQNSNDNKTFNDDIFLRNFRKNLLKKKKIDKDKKDNNNANNIYYKKNNTINIDNKNSRIISLSNDNKIVKKKKNLCINEKGIKLDIIKNILNNFEEKNNTNNNINSKKKINPVYTNNNESISSNKYLKTELYKENEINNDNSNIFMRDNINININNNITNNDNSYVNNYNKNNFNLISINRDNNNNNKNFIPIDNEHIYKSENNYKRKGFSLNKNYIKVADKINLSKLIQNVNQENEYSKSVNRKKNKSFFNRLNLKNKTIEPYNMPNRNSTIENSRIPVNLTKKLKNLNFERISNDIKKINEELMNNKFNNRRNLMRIKNNDVIKKNNYQFLPILTDNNRNIHHNVNNNKKI